MQRNPRTIVVLGTGGTIAGTAVDPADNVGYRAAKLGVARLVDAVPALAGQPLECEQVAQVDSKDMSFALWRELALRAGHHLARDEVAGVVVTHGTDTLEETAYFLQRVLAPAKPVAMTAAMRPATSLQADGPQNLLDAVRVASHGDARGVVAVLDGKVHGARGLRKTHISRVDTFASGDGGPLGTIEGGGLHMRQPWPEAGIALGLDVLGTDTSAWPRVEIVTSHAGASGALVRAALGLGVQGLVVAATGSGTLHHALEAALLEAQACGVRVVRSSRCLAGGEVPERADDTLPSAGALTPVQARVELMLELMTLEPMPRAPSI